MPTSLPPHDDDGVYSRIPRAPVTVATVHASSIHVVSDEFRGDVGGKLTFSLGDGIAIDGSLAASNADVDLLGRRYIVERTAVTFDGTFDPLLDIQLSYDFPTTTLYAKISGRLTKPKVDLSSSPANYTQDELFGFFIGGSPGGDPGSQARDAASSAAAGAASSVVSVLINRLLPKKVAGDVQFRYETATSASSAAFVVGWWVTHQIFVAGRSRSDPLPIVENDAEGDLEWWLGRNWLLEGTFGDRQVGGADLLWRHRW